MPLSSLFANKEQYRMQDKCTLSSKMSHFHWWVGFGGRARAPEPPGAVGVLGGGGGVGRGVFVVGSFSWVGVGWVGWGKR